MSAATVARPRLIAPEVIQTSMMDCGPASLKCLLEGFGIHVSFGRLREACQTSVDGTSIDTLEEIAIELGLDVEQVMLPTDHALLPESKALPALAVVKLPSGATHFIVLWSRHGDLFQVMDPGSGRRWIRAADLERELYVHTMRVPADGFRAFASSTSFRGAFLRRLRDLGVGAKEAEARLAAALEDESYASIATLDAAARMLAAVVVAGGIRRGAEAARALGTIYDEARRGAVTIPEPFWSAQAVTSAEDEEAQVKYRGAVLVRIRAGDDDDDDEHAEPDAQPTEEPAPSSAPRSPELTAALSEPPVSPLFALARMLRDDGVGAPLLVALALFAASAGAVVEAVLLRALFDAGRYFLPGIERSGAVLAVAAFVFVVTLLEVPVASLVARIGRHLETRMRAAYLAKLPRLGDRYFASRLASDMAERGHALHLVRRLPEIAARLLRAVFALALTTAGIVWLSPSSGPIAAVMAIAAVALPLALQPLMAERDLRFRTHQGALTRFYLDALLGLVPIRAHNAARTVRREHEGLLVDWTNAGFSIQRSALAVDAALAISSLALASVLVFRHLGHGLEIGSVLLLVYWTLQIPVLGEEVAAGVRQYPALRSVAMRLLELLGAPDESHEEASEAPLATRRACAIAFDGVTARAGGNDVLREVTLRIAPGEHVAIVGASGAGKSSLMGLLLGWLTPTEGLVLVDDRVLDAGSRTALRDATAWLDPGVHLWNRSLLENLLYGARARASSDMSAILAASDLEAALARLPDGLQTVLGEGGALLSGGEGQRVRLARALTRPSARLAILDEPFRGLDRERRGVLLGRARETWKDATLFCVTHDIAETRAFDRVLVVEDGRVIEDGAPTELLAREGSRYGALVASEERARTTLWDAASFRRLRLEAGALRDGEAAS